MIEKIVTDDPGQCRAGWWLGTKTVAAAELKEEEREVRYRQRLLRELEAVQEEYRPIPPAFTQS